MQREGLVQAALQGGQVREAGGGGAHQHLGKGAEGQVSHGAVAAAGRVLGRQVPPEADLRACVFGGQQGTCV